MDDGVVVRDVWRTFGAVPALSGMTLVALVRCQYLVIGPTILEA